MTEATATRAPETDANHPNGTDPNGDVAPPMATTDTAPTATKPRKQTKYELAGVGDLRMADGTPYLNPTNGRFHVGRDATLKSDLVKAQLAFEAEQATKPEAERADVTATPQYTMLAKLDWLGALEQSRKARDNRAARKAATKAAKDAAKQTPDGNPEPTVDRIEEGKKNKAAAQATVDQVVDLGSDGKRPILGRVLRVRRSDEADITAPWVATVAVPDNPRNPDGPFGEREIPVADLKLA